MKLHLKFQKDDEDTVYLVDHWLEITGEEATDTVVKNIRGSVAKFSKEQKQALTKFLDEWDFDQAMAKLREKDPQKYFELTCSPICVVY